MPQSDLSIFSQSLLKVDVTTLGTLIDEATEKALMQICHLIVAYAISYVPVDRGSLRDSIRIESGGEGWLTKRVRAGGYVTNPRTGRLVDYAAYVEAQTPFMAPALAQVEPEIMSLLTGELHKELKRSI